MTSGGAETGNSIASRLESRRFRATLSAVGSAGVLGAVGLGVSHTPSTVLLLAALSLGALAAVGAPGLWLGFVIVFATNIFGFSHASALPGLSMAGFGRLSAGDAVLGMAVVHAVALLAMGKTVRIHSLVTLPMGMLILLIAVEVTRNLLTGLSPHALFNGLRHVAYFVLFFVALAVVRRRRDFKQLVWALIVFASVTGAVSVYQFIFRVSLPGSTLNYVDTLGIFRVYQTGDALMEFAFLLSLALLLVGAREWKLGLWLAMLFAAGGFLVSFARSTWAGILLGSTVVILMSGHGSAKRILAYLLPFLAAATIMANTAVRLGGVGGLGVLQSRFASGIVDVQEGTGTFARRLGILAVKWQGVSEDSPLLGRGFDWPNYFTEMEAGNEFIQFSPLVPSGDSGIASVFVIFGYTGFAVFVWLFVAVFCEGKVILRNKLDVFERGVAIAVVAFSVESIWILFFSGRLTRPPEVAVLALAWALLVLCRRGASAPVEKPRGRLRALGTHCAESA